MNHTFGLPFIVLGALLVWICMYFWREGRDLRSAGVQTRAILTSKCRKPGDRFLFGLENCFVTAEFVDAQQVRRVVEVRVPSEQWHMLRAPGEATIVYLPSNPARARVVSLPGQTVISMILVFGSLVGAMFVLFGIVFVVTGVSPGAGGSDGQGAFASAPEPPPSKFDKSGVSHSSMIVSPNHDRVAVLDEKGRMLNIRELTSGTLVASAIGHAWHLLGWSPNGSRVVVAEGRSTVILDAESLRPVPGDQDTWNRESTALGISCPSSIQIWDAAHKRVAAACGNNVMVADGSTVHVLTGHRDRVLGVAWSLSGRWLASVSDDNYVRVWNPETQRCIAVSEDYPYPRTMFFATENTITVIDAALRQYTMRIPPLS